MQVAILAGGVGVRIGSTDDNVPKPMVRVGIRPIIWHIMKHYEHFGFTDFILCLGHKGDVIRDYFLNYRSRSADAITKTLTGEVVSFPGVEDWRVLLAETGELTGTGGRLKRVQEYVHGHTFMATYGDSLSDVDISKLLEYHKEMGLVATMSVMHSSLRFGQAVVDDGKVISFTEKPKTTEWINGGFYVFDRKLFEFLDNDSQLEYGPLTRLAEEGELAAYQHTGAHRAMDTPRDVKALNDEWDTGHAEWKIW